MSDLKRDLGSLVETKETELPIDMNIDSSDSDFAAELTGQLEVETGIETAATPEDLEK